MTSLSQRLRQGAILGLWVLTAIAATAATRRIDLAPGSAEYTLNEFAVQTGLQVLFPTELTAGVKTNAVRGYYSVREALDRLLSDTGLAAKYNEQTGIIEIFQAKAPAEAVVRLPPYTVEGDGTSWRYAKMGNIELLSSCMDDVTNRVMVQLFRLQEALGQILPPDLLFQSSAPVVYVLHSDLDKAAVPQSLIDRLKQREQRPGTEPALSWNIGIMRSYGFWDMDGRGIYFILNEGGFMVGRLSIRGDYLRELLVRRSPELPAWFVEGVMELYPTVTLEPYGSQVFAMEIKNRHKMPGGVARVAPFVWISDEQTHAVRRGHKPDFIPLAELLGGPPPPPSSLQVRQWRAQAALFVRWALDEVKGGREGLWQLARLADRKQPTEADFVGCFGMNYAEAEKDLRKYLGKAIRREFELKPEHYAEMPAYTVRMANESDVAIVKGDLDRLKIDYVRRFAPRLVDRYVEQAVMTLRRGLDLGDSSLRLAGLMGLCECDVGDDLRARRWLEQAVAGGDTRPRVYYELARIRFQEQLARAPASGLSETQIAELLRLLETARGYAPPLVAAYHLMADMLAAGAPSPAQLVRLDEGLASFPRNRDLIRAVVKVYRQHGLKAEAEAVLARALAMVQDPGDRESLRELEQGP
ncbi:MAG: secretin and TonB N-terminal domain-containing protein [Cephaloticoccus sp.]